MNLLSTYKIIGNFPMLEMGSVLAKPDPNIMLLRHLGKICLMRTLTVTEVILKTVVKQVNLEWC